MIDQMYIPCSCKMWHHCMGYAPVIYWDISKTKKGEDRLLFICSYVAEKPGGCWEELTCGNVKFHSLFNSYLSTLNQYLDYLNALI